MTGKCDGRGTCETVRRMGHVGKDAWWELGKGGTPPHELEQVCEDVGERQRGQTTRMSCER